MLKTDCPQKRLPAIACIWLGMTILAVPFDARISEFFTSPLSLRVLRPCLAFFDFMGLYAVHALCFTIVMASVPKARTAVRYMVLMGGSTILYSIIKIVVGRARPNEHLGPFSFHPFTVVKGMDSFPSGQATSAIALATLLGLYFPKGRWWFWAMGGVAALGRVAEHRHFMSDTVFGAGFGLLFVLVVGSLLPGARECGIEPIEGQEPSAMRGCESPHEEESHPR